MSEILDWRKILVRRDARFESLEEKFCSTKGVSSNTKIFNTVKELMVFAALVGFELDEYKPIEAKAKTTPILLDTYATTGHDAYIYLLALARSKSLDILKDENLKEAVNIFETYCNSGLIHIDNWIMKNIGEPIMTNILFNEVFDFLINKTNAE